LIKIRNSSNYMEMDERKVKEIVERGISEAQPPVS